MGDFEYYSELIVFLETELGREFVRRLASRRDDHYNRKLGLATNCKNAEGFEKMREPFLKEAVIVGVFDELLSDLVDINALKDLCKRLKEELIK